MMIVIRKGVASQEQPVEHHRPKMPVACLFHSQVSDEDTCHQVFRPGHPLFAASSFLLVTSQLAQPREQRRWFQTMHVIDIHECQPHLSLLVNKKRPWDGQFP